MAFSLWFPYLTPHYFFLWGFIKERVYSSNPRSVEEIKHNIEQAVADSDEENLWKDAENTVKGVNAYLQEGGGRFQHVL